MSEYQEQHSSPQAPLKPWEIPLKPGEAPKPWENPLKPGEAPQPWVPPTQPVATPPSPVQNYGSTPAASEL